MYLSRLAAQKEFEFMKVHPFYIADLRYSMKMAFLFLNL
jgi:hypothetical protein